MHALKRLADAVQRPFSEHEAQAQAEYERSVAEKHARGMGLVGSRSERYAAHKRGTEMAPVVRLPLRRPR